MSVDLLTQAIANLTRALDRLEEALDVSPTNTRVIDGTIKRFEFTFEQSWKTLKRALAMEGIGVKTPRAVLREAYSIGGIDDEARWSQMMRDRNNTAHRYNDAAAYNVYDRIRDNAVALRKLQVFLVGRYGSTGTVG